MVGDNFFLLKMNYFCGLNFWSRPHPLARLRRAKILLDFLFYVIILLVALNVNNLMITKYGK